MMRDLRALGALAVAGMLVLAPASSRAVQPDEMLPDPGLEARARTISEELRCLVCQNQSIDDSEAPLARDLRLVVRERLKAGDTDRAVQDYIVRRYGEFVLLRPVLAPHTALLWFGPPLVLLAGLAAIVVSRRSLSPRKVASLTPDEEAKLHELVGDSEV